MKSLIIWPVDTLFKVTSPTKMKCHENKVENFIFDKDDYHFVNYHILMSCLFF